MREVPSCVGSHLLKMAQVISEMPSEDHERLRREWSGKVQMSNHSAVAQTRELNRPIL